MPKTPSRARPAPGRAKLGWVQDPEGVRRNILEVARAEFAQNGLSGARMNEIAARTATSKRMIYYYFVDKEGLYRAVLEDAYGRIRTLEKTLDLAGMKPAAALAALVGFTFDYHADHADFVRLVMVENIHHARNLKTLSRLGEMNLSAIDMISHIYQRGVKERAFRSGLYAMDIHLSISALSFHNVSNRASVAQVFGRDMGAPKARIRRRAVVVETILRYVSA